MIAIQDNLPVDCTVDVDVGFTVGELVEEGSGSSAQERLDKSIVTLSNICNNYHNTYL